jgi:hypothetical protein
MSDIQMLYRRKLTTAGEALRGLPKCGGVLARAADHPRAADARCVPARGLAEGSLWLGQLRTDRRLLSGRHRAVQAPPHRGKSHLPRTHRTGIINVSQLSAIAENGRDIPLAEGKKPTDIDRRIAAKVSPMVPDGPCVKVSVGAVPAIAGGALKDRRNLGVHAEPLSDAIASLIKCGAVTTRCTATDPGRACSTSQWAALPPTILSTTTSVSSSAWPTT